MGTNYVSLLNEHAQKNGWSVQYEVVNTCGLEHMKTFTMKVMMNNQSYPEGAGRNKKEAKQLAAKNALDFLENDDSLHTETVLNSSVSFTPVTQANYVCWLNEHSHKKRLSFQPKETTKMSPGSNLQTSIHQLRLSTPPPSENTTPDKNYIGLLNEYCQKSKQVPNFKAVGRRGPAHDPEFVFKVIINNKEYPEGQGRTAKEARQKAAQQAWTELHESDFSSQISSPSSVSESTDDVSMLQRNSSNNTDSLSIIFASSSSVPEPQPQPSDVKPKRQLAANFHNLPGTSKKQSNINALKMAKPSTKITTDSDNPTKSRFEKDFDSITPIGKGGFGQVFKARRKLEDKYFAVKIVKFNTKARREVIALSHLDHANIVRYHTSWTDEIVYRDDTSEISSALSSSSGSEFLYMQMEFCEGETLRQWIEERNNRPEEYPKRRQEATEIIKQVLEAVKYIHLENLFHRDLKPANIMFGDKGVVKVGDFGLVTTEEVDEDGSQVERTKNTGTRSYMSPEQKQKQLYDRKVDIYAMGLVYFELLWCFGTRNEKQKQWEAIRSKKFPETFSKKFNFEHKQIERMLCEDPEARPEASDLLAELKQHSAPTASPPEHKNRTC
ncbi:interferon-induced, double-stranded RNA-activated protein kinase isoform X2 [Neoarius graeffei]|uniref:interferon-induced, double-stranded RNA-activated protein kinase isoform X2 n=1 Tax=Neoarius graeffei TaxID=443677 RepID=UPI00298C0923|nr:interferon-induced, double-stranded RNA-activated protein kinase isoform X2 [Neoarius graeffei]